MNNFTLTATEVGLLFGAVAIFGIPADDRRVQAAVAKIRANVNIVDTPNGYDVERFRLTIVEG